MKRLVFLVTVFLVLGCAKVSLQTAKPLKVDISMRVDVYQHVAKDVASIEDEIYGQTPQQKLNALFNLESAYAQDYSVELSAAIERRKARMSAIDGYFSQGYIGENKDALLEIVAQDLDSATRAQAEALINEENQDREIIYRAIADKNSSDVATVKKASFEDHYKRAASGYWFQVYDESKGGYAWIKK